MYRPYAAILWTAQPNSVVLYVHQPTATLSKSKKYAHTNNRRSTLYLLDYDVYMIEQSVPHMDRASNHSILVTWKLPKSAGR